MSIRLSDYFEINEEDLDREGVFNAFIDIDSKLFLDPHLLKETNIPELAQSYSKLKDHFRKIIVLLKASRKESDLPWQEAAKRLRFKETRGISIGYGKNTNDGHGIGPGLRSDLLKRASEIVSLGVEDPEIFELIGLFADNFGPDLLSDMTINVVREDLDAYSARLVKQFEIKKTIKVGDVCLPRHPDGKKPARFLPKELLRDIPTAQSREDISRIVSHNQQLRERFNRLIAQVWKSNVKTSERKSAIKSYLYQNNGDLKTLVGVYGDYKSQPYDFNVDPKGEVVWFEASQKFGKKYPLRVSLPHNPSLEDIKSIVQEIIIQFKKLIENNGLNYHLYSDDHGRKPRNERYAQLLFYGVADVYCRANDIDLSREPNAGVGPVDFKYSTGYTKRVLVEVKLSSNNNLISGYEKQLEIYKSGEATQTATYLVIKNGNNNRKIKNLQQVARESKLETKPNIVIIDGTIKPSASKRK